MKLKIVKLFIFLFLTICLSNVKTVAQIQGGVFDQNKQGIANALVLASDSTNMLIDSVRSDNRGFYMFKGLKPGKYKIEAKATGFRNAVFENVKADPENPEDNIRRNDISSATRLEIVLTPAKIPK